ncbi:MAG: DUF4416 family protein [Gemmataceae bacterium]|nr:DUF4416 family protein [Gemmataceae bacterium]
MSRLVVAAFSRHQLALDWAQEQLSHIYGPIERVSPDYDFDHTAYYASTMGLGLKKRLIVFAELIAFEALPEIKNRTMGLEFELAASRRFAELRPLNLDPGMLQLGKFLLATTKDQAHRIYLRHGVYAEVTLRFQANEFHVWPWTYADYREPAVRTFLTEARQALHNTIQLRRRQRC